MSTPPFALSTFAGGRRLLLAGFGALLILMLAAGVDALLVLRKVRASDAQVRDAYFTRSRSLEGVRAGIYESAIVMRDFLLARDPEAARTQEQQWMAMRESTDSALATSAAALDDQEQPRVRNLQTQLAAYWKLMDLAAETNRWDPDAWSSPYFSGEMLRRRNAMIDLIDQIDQLSARDLAASDATLNSTFDALRVRLIVMLVATFGVGMFVAGFTIARTLRLETELQNRYVELQELSARLVSAQEEERRAISRELHDEVGQSLSALLMEAGNAAATVPAGFAGTAQARRVDQEAGGSERQCDSQHDAAAAAVHAGRFRAGAGAGMAGSRGVETHRTARARFGGRKRRASSGRTEDVHLSGGAGGAAQLRAAFAGAKRARWW